MNVMSEVGTRNNQQIHAQRPKDLIAGTHREEILSSADVWRTTFKRSAGLQSFLVPSNKIVWGYGFRLIRSEDPRVAFLHGDIELGEFYQRFRPRRLNEAFVPLRLQTSPNEGPAKFDGVPFSGAPWLSDEASSVNGFRGEEVAGVFLSAEHGVQHLGPISELKLELEKRSLRYLGSRIHSEGFLEGRKGFIRGYFLVNGSDFRFILSGGKHRAAALAYLGLQRLPVTFQDGYPRAVDIQRLPSYQQEVARLYFDRNASGARKRLIAACATIKCTN